MTSQLNVENVKTDFNEYIDDGNYELRESDEEDEIAGRRRYISVAAINAAKVRKRGQNSSPISPPNWNWNEPSSQTGRSNFNSSFFFYFIFADNI